MIPQDSNFSLLALDVRAAAAVNAHRIVGADGAYPAAGGLHFGVTRHAASTGELVTVDVSAMVPVEAGGAFAQDAPLMVGAEGTVVEHDGTATSFPVGRSLQSSSGAGSLVSVWVIPHAGMLAVPVGV